MGQEAFTMFPALAEMQARSQLMRAQAGAVGQENQLLQQKYGQDQSTYGAFANSFRGVPPGMPGGTPMPPAPGQASMPASPPMDPMSTFGAASPGSRTGGMGQPPVPAVRVPQPATSNMVITGDSPAGAGEDLLPTPSSAGATPPVPQPGAPSQPAAPHKWTPEPGAQYDTPDGSKPRSLDEVLAAIRKANPKADSATIGRAAALYLPWMTEQDQMQLKQAMMENTAAIHASDAQSRAALAAQNQDAISGRAAANRSSREKIAAMNISGREKLQLLRNDAAYAGQDNQLKIAEDRLEQARAVLEQTKTRDAQTAYFKALAAKNNADYNLVSIMAVNHDLTDAEKAQIIEDVKAENAAAVDAGKRFVAPAASAASGGRRVKTTGGPAIRVPGVSTDPRLDPGTPAAGFH